MQISLRVINKLSKKNDSISYYYKYPWRSYFEIQDIIITLQNDYLYIKAELKDYYKAFNMRLVFDKNGNLISYHCPCDDNGYCEHLAVLIRKLEEIEPDEFPFSLKEEEEKKRQREEEERKKALEKRYYNQGSSLFRQYKNEVVDARKRSFLGELDNRRYTMLVYNNGDLSFKIGLDKYYVVKNLETLIENFENRNYYSYGKSLAFTHDYEKLDDGSKILYKLIKENINNSYYYYSRELQFNNRIIDTLIENKDVLKNNLQFNIDSIDEKPIIKVEKQDGYLKLNFLNNYYKKTDHYLYYFNNNDLYYYENANKELIALYNTMIENNCVYIDNKDLNDFYKYIYPGIENIVIFKDYEFNDIGEVNDRITIKGDIDQDDNVSFELIAHYDNEEINALELNDHLASADLEVVQSAFENFATFKNDHAYLFDPGKENTLTFINDYLPNFTQYADVFVSAALKKLGIKQKYKINLGVSVAGDTMVIDINTLDFPIEELSTILAHYRQKKKYYRLKNGEVLSLNSDDLGEIDELLNDYHLNTNDIKEGQIKTNLFRSLAFNDHANDFKEIEIQRKQSFKEFVEKFKTINNDEFIFSENTDKILRDYQKDGVRWLDHLNVCGFNGILADDMGLGKTLEVLALLDKYRTSPNIVICPSSLIINWQEETQKFTPDLKCLPIYGNANARKEMIKKINEFDLIITSYDYLRRDIESYQGIEFEYVVLDEAQYIKNQNTQNAKATKSLISKHRLALTGTPIENNLAELWSIFDFLMKDYLFPYHYFKETFEKAIIHDNDEKQRNKLKQLVEPFIMRRTKKEVLTELPDKIEQTITYEFNDEERKLYQANAVQISKTLANEIKDLNIDRIRVLAMLTRLRQLCLEPRLVYDNIKTVGSKLTGLMELLQALKENGSKVLLFSAFTSALDLIKDECINNDISYLMLTGQNTKLERKKLVDSFQNGEADIFLISLKAGGTGLNLTAADTVIHFDPWWNLSAQNQATDRAYRIGQTKNVNVYKLIMKDSIEEKIIKLQNNKKELVDMFVENNNGSLSSLSLEQLQELFA